MLPEGRRLVYKPNLVMLVAAVPAYQMPLHCSGVFSFSSRNSLDYDPCLLICRCMCMFTNYHLYIAGIMFKDTCFALVVSEAWRNGIMGDRAILPN